MNSMSEPLAPNTSWTLAGSPLRHESAHLHVTGEAQYTDDIPLPPNTVHAALGMSAVAHGTLRSVDLSDVMTSPGAIAIATAEDIPGENSCGPILEDDPIFATDRVAYAGQSLFAVGADSYDRARRAAQRAKVQIDALPAILDVRSALAARSFVIPSQTLVHGDPHGQLRRAQHRLRDSVEIGGQDQFYLEGQIAVALPQEDGAILVYSSTQHPTEVQHKVADALGLPAHKVVVQCRRMGGGFGGKESQPALFACAAAVLAVKTGRPVKLRVDRDADMIMTGKRHDFIADYDVGFDRDGRITALVVMLASRCGHSADLSGPVNDRAMFHVDNAYFVEHVEIVSHRCRTHTVSNTAFRGFGGPQGMMVIEAVIDHIARTLDLDPLDVRRANFYGIDRRKVTPYGQTLEDNVIHAIADRLESLSDYRARRAAVARFNTRSPVIKRGIALTPVKFGISFNATIYNQAGALVNVYTDGTILVSHGGTEMGQGLHTKIAQVVAAEFGVPAEWVRVSATDTSKVPNTSATAASSGTDLNGKAAQAAAQTIIARIVGYASGRYGVPAEAVRLRDGKVHVGDIVKELAAILEEVHAARISLSATGFYRTPKIHYDRASLTGRPFFYFAYGAAVSEVAIDILTGESRLLRVDIVHDVGTSLNPAIDRGQIEGGFLQGVGWLTSEELWWNEHGVLKTHAPSTYKIPTIRDWPVIANVELLEHAPNPEDTIHRSKAVGEPPLMLAISVFHAIRDAVASCGGRGALPPLSAPATPEAILRAVNATLAAANAATAPNTATASTKATAAAADQAMKTS